MPITHSIQDHDLRAIEQKKQRLSVNCTISDFFFNYYSNCSIVQRVESQVHKYILHDACFKHCFPKRGLQWTEDTINDAFDLLGKQLNNAKGQRNMFKTEILARSHFPPLHQPLNPPAQPFFALRFFRCRAPWFLSRQR